MTNLNGKEYGTPAFPTGFITDDKGVIVGGSNGMTLRDYFAAKALQGAIAHGLFNDEKSTGDYAEYLSFIAYVYADAMMKARK